MDTLAELTAIARSASGQPIHMWWVYPQSEDVRLLSGNATTFRYVYQIAIEGFYSLSDDNSSEVTFRGIVDDLQVAMRRDMDPTGGGSAVVRPARLIDFTFQKLLNMPAVHHALLLADAHEFVTDSLGGP